MTRPECKNCGKSIAKRTEAYYAPRIKLSAWPIPDWEYAGNQIVVAKRFCNAPLIGAEDVKERRLDHVYVWDGETYAPVYGYFCSGVCAGQFARAVVEF